MKPWPGDERYYLNSNNEMMSRRGFVMKGTPARGGYMVLNLNRTTRLYHRVIMECHIGRMLSTDEHIDHVNGDRSDNRISNLRITTLVMNNFNRKEKIRGFHAVKGGVAKPYRVRIYKDNKAYSIGYFATKEDARAAYLTARKRLHPGADEMDPYIDNESLKTKDE